MKRFNDSFLCASVIAGFFAAVSTCGQDNEFATLAARIIKTTANVKPGEVIVISGGKHNLPIMEELAIEAQKAGGLVTMFLDSDRVQRALFKEVPEQYLAQNRIYLGEWIKHVDVMINLPSVEDPNALFAGVPPERIG